MKSPVVALLMHPDATSAQLIETAPELSEVQKLVGGWVEPLGITPDAVMYLNEEGKCAGLAINALANKLVYLADPGLHRDDYIVGPVVIFGTLDERGRFDGAEHDVPESVFDLCRRAGIDVQRTPEA